MGHPHYKELIFKSLQYLFIIKKPERHKTITPNSGRPFFDLLCAHDSIFSQRRDL